MIKRESLEVIKTRLAQFDSVALIGPRQVGKTTLAKKIAADLKGPSRYLDLENAMDRRLLDDPVAFFSSYSNQLIILDEIQRAPEIFSVLRGQIDERRRMGSKAGKFLILGSASVDLLRQSSESLAGRISYVELGPLTAREIKLSKAGPENYLDQLWVQGGFPSSYLRTNPSESLQWRMDFIQTYLERDLTQFGLRVVTDQLDRFWRMLANNQGGLFNAQRYAKSLGVSGHTITRYLDILDKLQLVRILRPWPGYTSKRLVKSTRPFIRDSGIVHALLNLKNIEDVGSHAVSGKSWEGFVIENLINAGNGRVKPYFYRSGAGAEADLVLEFASGRHWAIEIKLSTAPTVDRGFYNAADDIGVERRLLVYKGQERLQMRGRIEAMSLIDAINEVSVAVNT